jgi:hypothetical protein
MDCPGIIFARASTPEEQADVMLRNCVRAALERTAHMLRTPP